MADLEIMLRKIDTKLQMLQITRNEYPRLLQRNKIRELEKHPQLLEERLEEVHELKEKIQKRKLEQEENVQEIKKWTSKHEAEVQEYDAPNRTMELKERKSQERKAEVDQLEEARMQLMYNEERKLEIMRIEVGQVLEKKTKMSSLRNARENPKLPKLIISKFEGINLDWVRF